MSSATFEVDVKEEEEEEEEDEEEEEAARTQSQKSATEVSRCTQFPSHIGPGAAGAAVARRRWKRAVAVRVPQTDFSVSVFQRRAAHWSMHPPITAGRRARTMLRRSASDGLWWKDAGERCRWPGKGIASLPVQATMSLHSVGATRVKSKKNTFSNSKRSHKDEPSSMEPTSWEPVKGC